MNGNDKLDEFLVAYLLGETNPADEQLVRNWIKGHKDNELYFNELARTVQLADAHAYARRIVPDEEWQKFKEHLASMKTESREAEPTELIYEKPIKIRTLYKIIVGTAIAASIMLAIGLQWNTFEADMPAPGNVAIERQKATDKNDRTLIALTRRETNNSGKDKSLSLSDGSVIVLSDKSEVSFSEPFTGNKREIHLKGQAYFDVAKDPERAFTVISGALSTTALGTKFSVEAFENDKLIQVKLYEGKVVVRSAHYATAALKDIYLLPGQQLTYDLNKSLAKFDKIPLQPSYKNHENTIEDFEAVDNPLIPRNRKGSWYMFNNQSLGKIFEQLEDMYDVEIVYSKKDVEKMYFIGTFNKSDSIENVLQQIASLNNLKVTKENSTFVIGK